MQMLAETMAATFKKGNEDVLFMEIRVILKKITLKHTHTHTNKLKLLKSLQKSALTVIRGYTGPENVNLNMMLREILSQETQRWGLPGSPLTKTRGKPWFSLKPSTSGNAAINIPALNDFLLFPQAVPSRILYLYTLWTERDLLSLSLILSYQASQMISIDCIASKNDEFSHHISTLYSRSS